MFSDADQDVVEAVLDRRRRMCPECGMVEDDMGWRDDDGKIHWYWPPPVEPVPITCFGCKQKAEAREDVPEEESRWTYVVLRRVLGWRRPPRDDD